MYNLKVQSLMVQSLNLMVHTLLYDFFYTVAEMDMQMYIYIYMKNSTIC